MRVRLCGSSGHPSGFAWLNPSSWLVNIQEAMEIMGKSPFLVEHMDLTSGKHTTNYGKSPFYSWVNQLFSMAISNSYVKLPEGNEQSWWKNAQFLDSTDLVGRWLTSKSNWLHNIQFRWVKTLHFGLVEGSIFVVSSCFTPNCCFRFLLGQAFLCFLVFRVVKHN